jgi:hypothetical protein
MKDGPHTHQHHRPGGLSLIAAILVALTLASAIRAILPELLIGLAVAAGLAVAGLIGWAAMTSSRHYDLARAIRTEFPHLPNADQDPERVIAALRAELAATRPAVPVQHHQHLHLEGLPPAQVAAILATLRQDPTADREGSDGD